MKKYERIITIILLTIISFSNIGTPMAYAAQTGMISLPKANTQVNNTTPVVLPSFVQPQTGSVLGASTSLLQVGTQELDLQQQGNSGSAFQRTPIRMVAMAKKVYRTDEDVQLAVVNPDDEAFTTSVKDSAGAPVSVPVTESNNGTTTTVDLAASDKIKPGTYHVTVTDNQGQNYTQDFSWGVLALNTDKSEYHPQETGDIAMAVLNDKGDMVCDANVQLQITNTQAGINDLLSTSATTSADMITVNPQCQKHDFSLQPDYEAHYKFGPAGTYNFNLTATTTNGTHTINDSINVTNQIPFDVQRVSATRIYPLDTYPMTFNITAHKDFSGTVTETVPEDFTITPATASAQTNSYDDMQTVYLNTNDPAAKLQQSIDASGSGGLVMPFHGDYPITQGFGAQMTDPTLQEFYTHYGLAGHDGIDFGVPMDTPLYAVDDGNIIWSGPGDYGVTVIISHRWGQSYYGHLSNTSVKVGDPVTKGQLIGYSGESGEATGPHLHFGMKPNNPDMKNGYYGKVDPMPYLPYGHQGQDTSLLGPSLSLPSTVLSASTSADSASDSAAVSATPTPTPTTVTPSAAPQVSVSPTPTLTPSSNPSTSSGSATGSATLTVSPTSTPVPNSNFSVLDKQIQENEALANAANTEEVKVITWHVTLKKGESTVLGYNYEAPHVSPQFYLLGPMQFYTKGSNKVVFQEQRQWEIASDDVGIEWYSNNTGNKFNGYSWQYRKKISVNALTPVTPALDAHAEHDGNTASVTSATITTLTVSASDPNEILILGVGLFDNTPGGVTVSTVTKPTWGAQTFTKLSGSLFDASNVRDDEIWYLVAPATGNHTLTVTFTGTTQYVIGAADYYNVNQTTPFGAVNTVSGTTSHGTFAISNPIASGPNQLPIDMVAWDAATTIGASGTGQVEVWNHDAGTPSSASSYAPSAGASTTLSWSDANNEGYESIGVSLQPASVTLSNFPVLVSLTSDTNLSNHAQGSGADILFTDSTGETLLPYEIGSYSSGTLYAWVKVSSLSSTSGTTIYMYYGNPSATGNTTSNINNTWNSNYVAVYHFSNGSFSNSASGSFALTNNSTTNDSSSPTGGGRAFNGSSQYLSLGSDSILQNVSGWTYTVWVKPAAFTSTSDCTPTCWAGNPVIASEIHNDAGNGFFRGELNLFTDTTHSFSKTFGTIARAPDSEGRQGNEVNINNLMSTGSWQFLATTVNVGSNAMLQYYNGNSQTTSGSVAFTNSTTDNTTIDTFRIGYDGNTFYNGSIAEVRVSHGVLPPGWISNEYSNENAPGSFYSVGGEETKIYAPTMAQVMRHGEWFSAEGAVQPFVF